MMLYITEGFDHLSFFINFIDKMTTKELDIKNRTYYFYNDLINVSNFESGNLKLDKKVGKTLIFIILVMLTKINHQIGK